MSAPDSRPPLEDVLDAYAVEEDTGSSTLQRYLREYPEYGEELVDLSRELSRFSSHRNEPLSADDRALIDKAWKQHPAGVPQTAIDLLATLTLAELRSLKERLGVPRIVVTAFRERRVQIASVPRRFLERFAAALDSSTDKLIASLKLPPAPAFGRKYKADTKPGADTPVSFEQLLIDAGLSAEERAALMADD